LLEGEPVHGFAVRGDRVEGVKTPSGLVVCDRVVVAAGPWSGDLLGSLGVQAPTPPVKGQIVLLRTVRPVLRRIVEYGKNYLVPRDDGRVLVGATEEYVGFDKRSTPGEVRDLLATALRLCPDLARAEVERAWAGLRPGSADARPYIGPLPGYSNAFVASGHKRTGLQQSTATAEVMTDLVMGRPPRIDLSLFRVDREPSHAEDPAFRS
jgi:glycine oxidase